MRVRLSTALVLIIACAVFYVGYISIEYMYWVDAHSYDKFHGGESCSCPHTYNRHSNEVGEWLHEPAQGEVSMKNGHNGCVRRRPS